MKRWSPSLTIGLALLAGCGPTEAPPAHGNLEETAKLLQSSMLEDELAWSLLESLTTEVGPRLAGSEGDARAVEWAVRHLNDLGFDRVWTEPVTVPRWRRGVERAEVVGPYPQPLVVTAIGGSPGTFGVLTSEVVRFESFEALEVADSGTVRDRIAFIDKRMEASMSGHGYGETVRGRSLGPFVAAEKGAAALVIRSVGTDHDRLPHTGNMSSSQEGEPVPSAALSNPDADLLSAMIDRGEPVSLSLELGSGFDGEVVSYNVIGEFDAVGDASPDELVVLAAHLDSWDLGTGAHDDGTGVAVVMTSAHHVASMDTSWRRPIRVVLFAAEETGLWGAKAYAREHESELARHFIGTESDLGGGRVWRLQSRVLPEADGLITELYGLLAPLDIEWDPTELAGGGADLGQMRRLGMPVVDLDIDASRYFDLHHTANDTLAQVDIGPFREQLAAYATFTWYAATQMGREAPAVRLGPVPTSE